MKDPQSKYHEAKERMAKRLEKEYEPAKARVEARIKKNYPAAEARIKAKAAAMNKKPPR